MTNETKALESWIRNLLGDENARGSMRGSMAAFGQAASMAIENAAAHYVRREENAAAALRDLADELEKERKVWDRELDQDQERRDPDPKTLYKFIETAYAAGAINIGTNERGNLDFTFCDTPYISIYKLRALTRHFAGDPNGQTFLSMFFDWVEEMRARIANGEETTSPYMPLPGAELPGEFTRWVDAAKADAPDGIRVMLFFADGKIGIGYYDLALGSYFNQTGREFADAVSYWRWLPASPEGTADEPEPAVAFPGNGRLSVDGWIDARRFKRTTPIRSWLQRRK